MKYLVFLALYAFAVASAAEFAPGDFKKSSAQYRAAAGQNPTMYTITGPPPGTAVHQVPTVKDPKGKDADHILEGQTVAQALNVGKVTKGGLRKTMDTIIGIMNHPDNVVFVDLGINRSKGQVVKSALSGGNPTPSAAVKDYMKQVDPRALKAANDIDAALKSANINISVSVAQTHKNAMKNAGV